MKIYLAARYSRLKELNGYAVDLRCLGHKVEARWLDGYHQIHEGVDKVEAATVSVPIEGRAFAEDDFQDVFEADMLIAFSEEPRAGGGSSWRSRARRIRAGSSMGQNRIIVVGPRENVFHTLSQVKHFWRWSEALEVLS